MTNDGLPYVPGYKTSEFWITILTYVISILNFSGAWNIMSNWHNGILLVVATSAYKIARGLVKSGALRAPHYPVVVNTTSQPAKPLV